MDLIPCHRVLREFGDLGGYRLGGVRKQAMLGWEAAPGRVERGLGRAGAHAVHATLKTNLLAMNGHLAISYHLEAAFRLCPGPVAES